LLNSPPEPLTLFVDGCEDDEDTKDVPLEPGALDQLFARFYKLHLDELSRLGD
jgi:hypothetical protein